MGEPRRRGSTSARTRSRRSGRTRAGAGPRKDSVFLGVLRLAADWYWKSDARHRIVHLSQKNAFGSGKPDWGAQRALLERRQPFRDIEIERPGAGGRRLWLALSGEPVFGAGGRFKGYHGVGRDITAKKRDEQLLRLEHAVTRIFAETPNASDALKAAIRALCESENWQCGRYLRVDAAAGVLRHSQGWCIAEPQVQRYLETSKDIVFPPGFGLIGSVWQTQEPLWVPDIARDPRSARPHIARDHGLRSSLVVPLSAEGRVQGVLILHCRQNRDVEERLVDAMRVIGGQMAQLVTRAQAEDDMRRFRLAMDSSADMIALVDRASLRYIDVNQTICRRLGYQREELLSLGPAEVVALPRTALERGYDALIADPSISLGVTASYRCKDGTLLPIESTRRVHRSGERWIIVAVSRDIRERMAAENALRESEARFRSLTELSSDWYWEQDAEFRFTQLTGPGATRMAAGGDPAAYLGKTRWEAGDLSPLNGSWDEHRARLGQQRPFRDLVLCRRMDDGSLRYMSVSGEPMFGSQGAFRGYRGVASDVTERVRGEQLLRLEHQVARALSEAGSKDEGLQAVMRAICENQSFACGRYFQLDEAAGVLRWRAGWAGEEPAFRKLVEDSRSLVFEPGVGLVGRVMATGEPMWSADIVTDPRMKDPSIAAGTGLHAALDFAVTSGARRIGVLSFSSRSLRTPDERLLQALAVIGSQVGQFLDRKRAERALRESAYSDPLTGLANRTSLGPALEQAVERARRRNARLAAMFVDLDGFKLVNDLHGHQAGDRFLVEIARRLRSALRASDLVARLGGDEFFVVLEDPQESEGVETVARKLLAEVARAVELAPGQSYSVSASIGISAFPEDAGDSETLIQHADDAMYRAKEAGKNAYRFFDASPQDSARSKAPADC